MSQFDKLQARLVVLWGKLEATASVQQIEVGKLAHQAVRCRLKQAPPKARRVFRAEAIDSLATALTDAGHRVTAGELNRSIRVFHVALLLGPDEAKKIPVRVLIELTPLIRRNAKTEEWVIKLKHLDDAKQLWLRVVADEVNAADVRSEVDVLLGRQPRAPKPVVTPAVRFASAVKATDDLATVLKELRETDIEIFRKLIMAVKATAVRQEAPPADPPGRKSFFGRQDAA